MAEDKINRESIFNSSKIHEYETKIFNFFKKEKYVHKDNLLSFLNNIIDEDNKFNSDELEFLWNHLLSYTNSDKLNYEETKKGFLDFISQQNDNSFSRDIRVSFMNEENIEPNFEKKKEFEDLVFNFDGEKLRKILLFFKILHISSKRQLSHKEIEEKIQLYYNNLKIELNDLLQFISFFSDFQKRDKTYIIYQNIYQIVEKTINNNVKEYKNTYIENKDNEYGESYYNFNICLEDIFKDEEESIIYPLLIKKDFQEDNDYFSLENDFLSKRRKNRVNILNEYFLKFQNEYEKLKEEYLFLSDEKNKDLYNEDYKERIEELIQEVNILNQEKEKKNIIIENKNEIICQQEKLIQDLNNKCCESQIKIELLDKENKLSKLKYQELEKNYNNNINELIIKLNKEEKEKEVNLHSSISTNFSQYEEIKKKFESKSNEEILSSAIHQYNENKTLNQKIKNLESSLNELRQKNESTESSLNVYKTNYYILKTENENLKIELNDIKKENEINKIFRPSNVINRISRYKESESESKIKNIPFQITDFHFSKNTKKENLLDGNKGKQSLNEENIIETHVKKTIKVEQLCNSEMIENKNKDIINSKKNLAHSEIKVISDNKNIKNNSLISKYDFQSFDLNNNYDNIFMKKKAIDFLINKNENINKIELFIDDSFLVNKKGKMEKMFLIICNTKIYITDCINSNLTIRNRDNLTKVILSSKNLNLIIFKFNKEDDIILQVMRRKKLIVFLQKTQNKKIEYIESTKFIINDDKEKKQKKKLILDSELIPFFPYYEKTILFGYLLYYEEIMKYSKYTEKFIVLCDLGLLIFDNPLSNPINIINIYKCEIRKCTNPKYGKKYGFEIHSNNINYVFFTKNENCLNAWMNIISVITKKYQDDLNFLNIKKD